MMPTVEATIELMKAAHAEQVDKAGRPYWLHPLSVMNRLGEGATDQEKCAALLHDVVEDAAYTLGDLKDLGYPEDVLLPVDLLTKPDGWSYVEYIRGIASSGNQTAIKVKIADNEDNLDPDRVASIPSTVKHRPDRYLRSLEILRAAVES